MFLDFAGLGADGRLRFAIHVLLPSAHEHLQPAALPLDRTVTRNILPYVNQLTLH